MITYRYIKNGDITDFTDEIIIPLLLVLDILLICFQPLLYLIYKYIDKTKGER